MQIHGVVSTNHENVRAEPYLFTQNNFPVKRLFLSISLILSMISIQAQTVTGMDESGQFTELDEQGNIRNNGFNPNRNDSTRKSKNVPKGIYVWRVDRKLGDIIKAEVDTLPHLYPNTTMGMGKYGTYNTIGSNYTARLSRIFIDRPETDQFIFTQAYNQVIRTPDQWHFTNTLSPITNLSYDNCGNKQNGEDHLDAKFAVNAGKKIGFGFDLDYSYARGYFQNQNVSHFCPTFYGSYLGDRYQLHVLYAIRHHKNQENGGITNDDYITHKELFTNSYSDDEIPVTLSSNWNRNNSQHLFLTHRYNVGFYRDVKMTDEEIEARKFAEKAQKNKEAQKKNRDGGQSSGAPLGRPDGAAIADGSPTGRPEGAAIMGEEPKNPSTSSDSLANDTTRIRVDSKQMADSLLAESAAEDSLKLYTKKEFVPVTSFIHTFDFSHNDHIYQAYRTPTDYYSDKYYEYTDKVGYPGDSIYDRYKYLMVRNTIGLGLLEGFNKWAKAGVRVFATHELRRFEMPQLSDDGSYGYLGHWTEHNFSVGGRLIKEQGKTLHYSLSAETWLLGKDIGQLKVDFNTDLNFPLWGDTIRLEAKAFLHRLNPTFFERNFHSKHFWWDESFNQTNHLRAEGIFTYEKTKTSLRVAIDGINNYTYLGMSNDMNATTGVKNLAAQIHQHTGIINVLTAQLDQKIQLGPLHWDNILTYQSSSNSDALPLPTLNIFTNLYLKFVYAKVLTVELGGAATYFTRYYAPSFVPQLNQFAVQENEDSKVKIGEFPIVDAYANLHLKHARFFVMMTNVFGKTLNRMTFLTPHYPINRSVLKMGVSWNFFN